MRHLLPAFALLASGCTFDLPPADPAGGADQVAPASIQAFAEAYAAAFVSGDPAAVAAMLTADFVAMAPETPALEGRETAIRLITADLSRMKVHWLEFLPVDIRVADDWAWVRGESAGEMVLAGVRHRMPLRGKFLWILERQADDRWLLAVDASSASEPHRHGPAPTGAAESEGDGRQPPTSSR